MKKRYYYICMLSVLLLMLVLPTKAASEAEFGKLVRSYTLRTDGSQEMRVPERIDFVYSCSYEWSVWREFYHLQSCLSGTEDT